MKESEIIRLVDNRPRVWNALSITISMIAFLVFMGICCIIIYTQHKIITTVKEIERQQGLTREFFDRPIVIRYVPAGAKYIEPEVVK